MRTSRHQSLPRAIIHQILEHPLHSRKRHAPLLLRRHHINRLRELVRNGIVDDLLQVDLEFFDEGAVVVCAVCV